MTTILVHVMNQTHDGLTVGAIAGESVTISVRTENETRRGRKNYFLGEVGPKIASSSVNLNLSSIKPQIQISRLSADLAFGINLPSSWRLLDRASFANILLLN